MTILVSKGIGILRAQWFVAGLVLVYTALFCWLLSDHVNIRSLDFQLGMLSMFVVVSSTHSSKKSGIRFGVAAMMVAIITCFLPVKTLLYITILLSVFFVVETYGRRIHLLSLLVVILVSPVCRYVMNIFSFPIRLQLTQWVGRMLSFTGAPSQVEGNIILYNGSEFSVDPACMGLYMLITSMLSGIMIVALQHRKYKKQVVAGWIFILLSGIAVCNVLCNLFRIFILVYYKILPGTMMHDVVGVACFFLYVIVPFLAITGWLIKRKGKPAMLATEHSEGCSTKYLKWMHVLVGLCCTIAALTVFNRQKFNTTSDSIPKIAGYTISGVSNNITKVENEQVLIYIKSIAGFYSSDHHPMICWGGSGYEFTKVHTDRMGDREVYAGVLNKNGEILYTAWWYDNGIEHTIGQWNWRWDMLKGNKPYALVNITAANPAELKKQVSYFIKNGDTKRLLH